MACNYKPAVCRCTACCSCYYSCYYSCYCYYCYYYCLSNTCPRNDRVHHLLLTRAHKFEFKYKGLMLYTPIAPKRLSTYTAHHNFPPARNNTETCSQRKSELHIVNQPCCFRRQKCTVRRTREFAMHKLLNSGSRLWVHASSTVSSQPSYPTTADSSTSVRLNTFTSLPLVETCPTRTVAPC
jgi:hypothetical protein